MATQKRTEVFHCEQIEIYRDPKSESKMSKTADSPQNDMITNNNIIFYNLYDTVINKDIISTSKRPLTVSLCFKLVSPSKLAVSMKHIS